MANHYYDDGSVTTGSYLAVTPSDSATLRSDGLACRAVNVAVAGTVAVVDKDGNTVSLYLAAGFLHRVGAVQVLATGTTATGIVAGF
jgi:hypothetical protein